MGGQRRARGADLTDPGAGSQGRELLLRAGLVAVPLLGLIHVFIGAIWPPESHAATLGDELAPLTSIGWCLRILLTLAIATAVVLGPGLWLRQRAPGSFLFGTALVWVPGTLVLAVTGLAAWLLAYRVEPERTVDVVLVPVLVLLTWSATRVPVRSVFVPGEVAVVGLLLLLVVVGVAKATWSQSPDGDMYAGTVSRTLESSDRPDSRIPFHVVQLVANGTDRYSDVAGAYFGPYSFADRPPMAGLAAAPVVLSSGAEPPISLLDEQWEPFDREGFAAGRVTLELLGATVVLATFGLLRAFLSRRLAWAGTLVVALTPFIVHEVYFTWPKLLTASFGVAALAAVFARRAGIAGALLGLSYLAHPAGLFVALTVGGLWLGIAWQRRSRASEPDARLALGPWVLKLARTGAFLALGLATCVVAWRLLNAGHFTQSGDFGDYPFEANTVRPVELSQWVASRARSIGNTLVPFELFVVDHDAKFLNSPLAPHQLILSFSLQYWNTLPFGVGLVYFPVFLIGLWRFARRDLAVALAGLLVPFVVFALYWGSYVTGLMREGLQAWVAFALIAAFLGHTVYDGSFRARAAKVVRVVMTFRGVEVLVMLLASTVLTAGWLGDRPFVLTDLVALAAMLGGVGAMMLLTWRAFDPAQLESGAPTRQAGSLRST